MKPSAASFLMFLFLCFAASTPLKTQTPAPVHPLDALKTQEYWTVYSAPPFQAYYIRPDSCHKKEADPIPHVQVAHPTARKRVESAKYSPT